MKSSPPRTSPATYAAAPKICPRCGKALSYKQRTNKFCSRSCAATITSALVTKRQAAPRSCPCGQLARGPNKFCDTCIAAGLTHTNQLTSTDATKNPSTLRRFLLRTRGHMCQRCLRVEWEGVPIPLEVEHVDGQSDNNTASNLLLLCPNCHALTPTYKNRNKGNGRHARRQRYRSGLSY